MSQANYFDIIRGFPASNAGSITGMSENINNMYIVVHWDLLYRAIQ
jgi:hypothetical protein